MSEKLDEKLEEILKEFREKYTSEYQNHSTIFMLNSVQSFIYENLLSLTDENARLKKEIECWKKWGRFYRKDYNPVMINKCTIEYADGIAWLFSTNAERDECYNWLMKQREGK